MKLLKTNLLFILIFALTFPVLAARVEHRDGKVFITDQTGYKWDVSQAKSLGFIPEKFQYGIGMNAFTTLDDTHLKSSPATISDRSRVIGIEHDRQSHAYSVPRLRHHEIANTTIGDLPIAAGY